VPAVLGSKLQLVHANGTPDNLLSGRTGLVPGSEAVMAGHVAADSD
jgi:hypothetical protein